MLSVLPAKVSRRAESCKQPPHPLPPSPLRKIFLPEKLGQPRQYPRIPDGQQNRIPSAAPSKPGSIFSTQLTFSLKIAYFQHSNYKQFVPANSIKINLLHVQWAVVKTSRLVQHSVDLLAENRFPQQAIVPAN